MMSAFLHRHAAKGLFATLALVVWGALAAAPPAQATDYNGGAGMVGDEGHFVRIGLNKSVVIRLPADARDVIVGNPAIVDAVIRTKNTAYLFARATGQTNIFFFDEQGRQIMNIDLEVALDMTALQKLIDRTIPGSKITADTVDGNVVLNGKAANAVDAKLAVDLASKFAGDPARVVDAMKVDEGDQVMLKVRVVEIQRSVMKSLDVDLDAALTTGGLSLAASTVNPILGANILGTAGYAGSNFSIDAAITAMEQDGVLHTLAEPTLSAVSGQGARFHAGGELPYRTCNTDTSGIRNCTVTFRSIGVSLAFTPIVLSEGRISLRIQTEVSEQGSVTIDDLPTVDSRQAETTVEIPSGGSMVMAGLIKNITKQEVDGTPGLRNLPVLGALFRSRQFLKNETEMVVIITPYIVNPVHEKDLATPADRFNAATDRDAVIFGRLNQIYGTAGNYPEGVYHGNVGFIIE